MRTITSSPSLRATGNCFGAVAQLGERRNGIAKVRGSIPLGSTILLNFRTIVTIGR